MDIRDIDHICDRFDAAWQLSEPPRLEDFLTGSNQSSLFVELLRVEISYRKALNEVPRADKYLIRFPQFAEVILDCFSGEQAQLDATVDFDPIVESKLTIDTDQSQPHLTTALETENHGGTVARRELPEVPGFQVLEEIGRGGMGIVLRARDLELDRDVAVKVLRQAGGNAADLASRFVEEAHISGQLQHPGIPPVYRLGMLPDRSPFFAMKLIKGRTLAELLAERQNLDQDRTRLVKIFEQICQTLAYAHSRHVIHRDLKPANVMVGAFAEVQVMDWGLAKVMSPG